MAVVVVVTLLFVVSRSTLLGRSLTGKQPDGNTGLQVTHLIKILWLELKIYRKGRRNVDVKSDKPAVANTHFPRFHEP